MQSYLDQKNSGELDKEQNKKMKEFFGSFEEKQKRLEKQFYDNIKRQNELAKRNIPVKK